MADESNLIHANGAAMAVSVESLADATARFAEHAQPVLARKRVKL
jgi:hypothetical protein